MRKFNKDAYGAHDKTSKIKVIEIMESTNKYEFIGGVDDELYKECDVKFKHIETGRIVRFENECRINFDKLVNDYDTIHIPVRKKNTLADFYLVWNYELTQFILIRRNVLQKSKDSIITVECRASNNATHDYDEEFLDVNKNECEWIIIGLNNKLIQMDWPS